MDFFLSRSTLLCDAIWRDGFKNLQGLRREFCVNPWLFGGVPSIITVWFHARSTTLIISLCCFQWNWFILSISYQTWRGKPTHLFKLLAFLFRLKLEWKNKTQGFGMIYLVTDVSSKYSKQQRAHKILLNLSWNPNRDKRSRKFCIFSKSHTGFPGSITAHSLMKRFSVGQERGAKSASSLCVLLFSFK